MSLTGRPLGLRGAGECGRASAAARGHRSRLRALLKVCRALLVQAQLPPAPPSCSFGTVNRWRHVQSQMLPRKLEGLRPEHAVAPVAATWVDSWRWQHPKLLRKNPQKLVCRRAKRFKADACCQCLLLQTLRKTAVKAKYNIVNSTLAGYICSAVTVPHAKPRR